MSPQSPSLRSISSAGSVEQLAESEHEPARTANLIATLITSSRIILLTDANTFASLTLLNSRWRTISQQGYLYSHFLPRCPSYSAAHHKIPIGEDADNLPRLRSLFAQEIKRNLFEAYLRPKETIINLVSSSISSSSAPGGEACHFSISPRGVLVLAFNSSRIHIIDVAAPEVHIIRELKILRRPVAVTITDDGATLAVMSTDLQIDLYDLKVRPPKHIRAVALDHTPRTIALSASGQVLAAAYDSGVELTSLLESGTSRAVKAYGVDSLTFSRESDLLLGTTLQSRNPSTVVITAPYYDSGSHSPEESVSALWTTSILFPNGSRDCSHAVLLPGSQENWAFTYDRIFETFRAVRIDDLRNGKVHFVGPNGEPPASKAAASKSGDLVAVGYNRGSIWLWGIPEDLDAIPRTDNGSNSNAATEPGTPLSQIGRRNSAPSLRSINRSLDHSNTRIPQWQLLCDKSRNTFVEGRQITSLDGVSALSWVHDRSTRLYGDRLVAVAPGVKGSSIMGEGDTMSPVDGGRISILDFTCGPSSGEKTTTMIEVGLQEPEALEEEHRDLDTEVAIVRRRTVAQRRSARASLARAATSVVPSDPPPIPSLHNSNDIFSNASPAVSRRMSHPPASPDYIETASIDEDPEPFDDPYSHTAPRSGTTLRRAATAAAVNRRLHPRSMIQEHIEFRRADGREDHPHESDADNWEPPPPPYQKDPVPPLPAHIQRSILAEHARSLQRVSTHHNVLDFPGLDAPVLPRPLPEPLREQRYPFNRSVSDTTAATTETSPIEDEITRPVTSPPDPDFDDLYDVSPVGTPQPSPPRNRTRQSYEQPIGVNSDDTEATTVTSNPGMRATLQQPLSPIPQLMNETLDQRLLDWESTGVEDDVSIMQESRPATAVAHETMAEPVLPPPEPPIALSGPDTIQPIRHSFTFPQVGDSSSQPVEAELDEGFAPIWRRVNTAPTTTTGPSQPQAQVELPSADLLERFNRRSGRPVGLTDPSRRRSGSLTRGSVPYQDSTNRPPRPLTQYEAPRTAPDHSFPFPPPPIPATAPQGSMPIRSNTLHIPRSRRLSVGSQRYSAAPNSLRPPLQRLETIHSAASNPSALYGIPIPVTVSRQPSRAERSAARNMKDAKRKGWRQSMKVRKNKDRSDDSASSAAWIDVTEAARMNRDLMMGRAALEQQQQQQKRLGGKCMVM
ncbi:F-box domain-containing protein [Rutstroemia sp. NJR-2017a BBW]|nr:F-box domain-containing protein [Rutstroemia sp. NJR-2017a BBW]